MLLYLARSCATKAPKHGIVPSYIQPTLLMPVQNSATVRQLLQKLERRARIHPALSLPPPDTPLPLRLQRAPPQQLAVVLGHLPDAHFAGNPLLRIGWLDSHQAQAFLRAPVPGWRLHNLLAG